MRVTIILVLFFAVLKVQAQINSNKIWVTKNYDIIAIESDSTLIINRKTFEYNKQDSLVMFFDNFGHSFPYQLVQTSPDSITLEPLSKICKYLIYPREKNESINLINPTSYFKGKINFDYIIFKKNPSYSFGRWNNFKIQIENNGRIYLDGLYEGLLNEVQQKQLVLLLEATCLDWLKVNMHVNIDIGSYNIRISYNNKMIAYNDFLPTYLDAPLTNLLIFLSQLPKEIEFSDINESHLPFIYKN